MIPFSNYRCFVLVFFVLLIQNKAEAQYASVDYTSYFKTKVHQPDYLHAFKGAYYPQVWAFKIDSTDTDVQKKWHQTDTGKSLIVSAGLMGFGLFTYKDSGFMNRIDIKDEINRYLPNFESPIDDYTQFLPYLAVYVLPVFGVETLHDNWRKTTTMATALGLNLLVVQAMKYTIEETRPDGSANNSFPSGHTATAFMGAHIFHKEYAHESPYYSVVAYVLASMTGIMRQLNNRHWVSDVFFGAGLGISLTELAYFFNDKIHGDKHINPVEHHVPKTDHSRPSYMGFKFGYASLVNQFLGDNGELRAKDGYRWTFDGAYFFNSNFGVGGEIGFQSFPLSVDQAVQDEFEREGYELITQAFGNRIYYLGPHAQFDWGENYFGGYAYIGAIAGPNTELFVREIDGPEEDEGIIFADYDPTNSFSWATGVYYRRVLNNNLSLKIYADYNWADLDLTETYLEDIVDGEPVYAPGFKSTVEMDSFSIGASVIVNIW